MQPEKAREFLVQVRDHIDGMLAADGDTKKIVWHFKRLRKYLTGPYRSTVDLARYALIASKEKDWWIPLIEARQAEHERQLARQRKGRTQCAACLPLCGEHLVPWVLPGEECPSCRFRRERDQRSG